MGKAISRLKPPRLVMYLPIILLLVQSPACSGSDNEPTVYVGQSRIKLIPYPLPGFTLIDDSNDPAYRAAKEVLGGLPEIRLLALYTDDYAWNNFVAGLTPDGPENMFEYAAQITIKEKRINQTLSLAQFDGATERVSQGLSAVGNEIIETGSRFVTFRWTEQLDGETELKNITTYILVEGKLLELETVCLSGSRFEDQFLSSSLAWRDAYLKQTEP